MADELLTENTHGTITEELIGQKNQEHILVCLSSSPSNAKIIEAAAKLAVAFHALFTAVYVQASDRESMSEEDKARLAGNIRLAERKGASITTVIGDNIPYQIAEFARASGVTRIVIGRSTQKKKPFRGGSNLTEQLIVNAPDIEIYIIPDSSADLRSRTQSFGPIRNILPSGRELFVTALLLAGMTCLGLLFSNLGFSEANIITLYILGVLISATLTTSLSVSFIGSLAGVLLFNYFFIEPKYSFHTYETEYAVTFAVMLVASLITGTLANRLQDNARQSSRAAFRTKVLLDTNQMLQKAKDENEVIRVSANQVILLLNTDVVFYAVEGNTLGKGYVFPVNDGEKSPAFFGTKEYDTAQWVLDNKRRAGAGTDRFPEANAMYLAVLINDKVYGVVGIDLRERQPESFEYSVLMSILGECALAMENLRNASEKEQAALKAQNEQLRANLLRSISHDLRTPLTSISGNASNLLSHYEQLDEDTRQQIFTDIYDDSEWLINLVENLLSVTRIEDGRTTMNLASELVEDVVDEALKHVSRTSTAHRIFVERNKDLLFAKMDAKLIVQVLVNLINNAVKYTEAGSVIRISYERKDGFVAVHVADNGPGIPKEEQGHVFDMFFTGQNAGRDSRKSLGLGLALCKSIVEAHGGSITLSDNEPSGCIFTFTLPEGEVAINE